MLFLGSKKGGFGVQKGRFGGPKWSFGGPGILDPGFGFRDPGFGVLVFGLGFQNCHCQHRDRPRGTKPRYGSEIIDPLSA